jgi:hypothetical protein
VPVADSPGRDIGLAGDPFHFQVYEVVADGQSPEFLTDTFWRAGAESLLAFEGVGLDFVEAEFQFPSFMIEVADLLCGIGDGIEERSEKGLWTEATPLITKGSDGQGLGELGMSLTGAAMDG